MTYHFESISQAYIKCHVNGVKKTIKFSMLHEGKSHYDTRNEEEAQNIRNSKMFRLGKIKELAATDESIKKEAEPVNQYVEPIQDIIPAKRPKIGARRAETPAVETTVTVESDEQTGTTEGAVTEGGAIGTAEVEKAYTNADDETSGHIDISDVTSYMEAKTYLKEVLHVSQKDISTRLKTEQYCKDNGVVFPNFEF